MTAVRDRRRAGWRSVVRSRRDLILVAAGAVVLVLSALPVSVHTISAPERAVFRAINDHTVLPFTIVWTIMQLGNFLAVPAAALVAILARRWRLGIGMLAGGVITYFLAKVVKAIVERGRPASVVDGVHIRGAAALGRGYVSGHAAVVTLLVVLAWPYLGRRARIAAVALAVFVCLARVYVGAHLPLDIVGGAALGLAVAGAIRLVLGRPAP
ncbi:MAG: phosphatase PAP2 family protein [Jatrophihabitantaceae bacterium]